MSIRKYFVTDLETITDPTIPLPEPRRCKGSTSVLAGNGEYARLVCGHDLAACPKCGVPQDVFLPPTFHRIVAIGYAILRPDLTVESLDVQPAALSPNHAGSPDVRAFEEAAVERAALRDTFEYLELADPVLVGWNSRGFDAPVLAARGLAHGLSFPWYYRGKYGPRYRYGDKHIDVKDALGDLGGAKTASLDHVAKSIGLPGKVGVDGSMVGAMIEAGRLAEVCDYCACDVAQTVGVLIRYLLLQGAIDLESYRTAAWSLVDEIDTNPRLTALTEKIDIERFCLGAKRPRGYLADVLFEEEREGALEVGEP